VNSHATSLAQKRDEERIVYLSVIPFCYPNGNYTGRIAALVRDAGYHVSVTTNHGWNRRNADPFQLRRIGIHQDMTSTTAMFGCRVVGVL